MLTKVKKLLDNRGEARMLLKGKRLIALLSSENPGIRHPAERQSEILREAQGDSEGARDDSEGQCRRGQERAEPTDNPPRDTLPQIGYRQSQVRR
jgi:hypothetical protein